MTIVIIAIIVLRYTMPQWWHFEFLLLFYDIIKERRRYGKTIGDHANV